MSSSRLEPNDNADIAINLTSGIPAVDQARYPQTFVYDPTGAEITGSPFVLTHNANGLYESRSAFQAEVLGLYKLLTKVYSDSGHTALDASYPDILQTLQVKREPVFGGNDGIQQLVISEEMKKDIAKNVWYYPLMEIKNDSAAGKILLDSILNIKLPEFKMPKIDLSKLKEIDKLIKGFKDLKSEVSGLNFSNAPVLKEIGFLNKNFNKTSNDILSDLETLKASLEQKENLKNIIESLEIKLSDSLSGINKDNKKEIDILSDELRIIKMSLITEIKAGGESVKQNIANRIMMFANDDKNKKDEILKHTIKGKEITVDMINQLNKEESKRLQYLFKILEGILLGRGSLQQMAIKNENK